MVLSTERFSQPPPQILGALLTPLSLTCRPDMPRAGDWLGMDLTLCVGCEQRPVALEGKTHTPPPHEGPITHISPLPKCWHFRTDNTPDNVCVYNWQTASTWGRQCPQSTDRNSYGLWANGVNGFVRRHGSCLLTKGGSKQHRHRHIVSTACRPRVFQIALFKGFPNIPHIPPPLGHSADTNEATMAPTPKTPASWHNCQ